MRNLNKQEIAKNFSNAAGSYATAARLQLAVVKELVGQCSDFHGLTLDLGAGPGVIGKNSGLELVELDISHNMSKLCTQYPVTGDFENLPFKNESFDNVISSLSLQWAGDLAVALQEIARVLKARGKLGFSTLSPNSLRELRNAFAYFDGDAHLLEFEPLLKIYAMLKKVGFVDVISKVQKITYQYDDIIEALKSMKSIGASYNFKTGGKALRSKTYFTQLENVYRNICGSGAKIPLKWEVIYFTCRKGDGE